MNEELPTPIWWVDDQTAHLLEWYRLRDLIDGETGPVSEMIEEREHWDNSREVARRAPDEKWLATVVSLLTIKAKAIESDAESTQKAYDWDIDAMNRGMRSLEQATYGQRYDTARDLMSFRDSLVEHAQQAGLNVVVSSPQSEGSVASKTKRKSLLARLTGG